LVCLRDIHIMVYHRMMATEEKLHLPFTFTNHQTKISIS